MFPLTMLFNGFGIGGGYNNCGLPAEFGAMFASASMNAAMQCGMPFGIFGQMGGVNTATQPYVNTQGGGAATAGTVQGQSAAELKTQMDAAYADYETYINLCSKISEYEADTKTTAAELSAAVADAEKNVLAKDKTLSGLLNELHTLQSNSLLEVKDKSKLTQQQLAELNNLNQQIQTKQKEIKQAEQEKADAQKAVEEAKQNLDAYNIAKAEDTKIKEEVFAKKEAAYKKYTELSAAYTSAQAREASATAAAQDRAADSRESGKWWDRTVLNPTNWFNKKGAFWGKTTDNADVAKCLRKLKKSGRGEALAYAQKEGLITITNGVASTTHSELQGLVELYNGKDPVAADPLNS